MPTRIIAATSAIANCVTPDAIKQAVFPGVTVDTSAAVRDQYTGTAAALLAAGLIAQTDLQHQPGRADGFTAFQPDGLPCPTNLRLSRHEGYKTVRRVDGGLYVVGITVSSQEQRRRRAAGGAARAEAKELRLNQHIAERGRELAAKPLHHRVGSSYEEWKGTKAQLQSQLLGVGMAFPGEPGAPSTLHCKCPLGFDVEIWLSYDEAEAACGMYKAVSRFGEEHCRPVRVEKSQYAPGVMLTVGEYQRTYRGTAAALVAAGLARLDQFPGQPNRPVTRCTYRSNGTHKTSGNHHDDGRGLVICKSGKTFTIETALTEEEERQRDTERKALKAAIAATDSKRADERRTARAAFWQLQDVDAGINEFREGKLRIVGALKNMVRNLVALPDGAFTLVLDETEQGEIDEALEALAEVIGGCAVGIDRSAQRAAKSVKAVAAARGDVALQSFLVGVMKPEAKVGG